MLPDSSNRQKSSLKSVIKSEKISSKPKVSFDFGTKQHDGKNSGDLIIHIPYPFNPELHNAQTKLGKRSHHQLGYFKCNNEHKTIFKSLPGRVFKNSLSLHDEIVGPMNRDFGSDCYMLRWTQGAKYMLINCKAQGCKFSVWFSYEALDA